MEIVKYNELNIVISFFAFDDIIILNVFNYICYTLLMKIETNTNTTMNINSM